MARVKQIISGSRRGATGEEFVTETFTHRQELPDGRVIYADPAARFWLVGGCSWYGEPPKGWDEAAAVESSYKRSYVTDFDYS